MLLNRFDDESGGVISNKHVHISHLSGSMEEAVARLDHLHITYSVNLSECEGLGRK
jgi:hypothetical protein